MADDLILSNIDGTVATLTFNRPEKRNAINGEMLETLEKEMENLRMNKDVSVVVLKGNGPCFAAGIDLTYLADLSQVEPTQLGLFVRTMARNIQTVMNVIENVEKPVVACIHGFCGGLALELAMACDFRIVSEDATFGLPEIVFGLLPDCGGTTRLTRALGITRAKELVMLGDMIDAKQAHDWGIVTRVYKQSAFEEECGKFIDKILDLPTTGMGLAKRLIDIGAHTDKITFNDLEAALQSILITSPDFADKFQAGMMKINERKSKKK